MANEPMELAKNYEPGNAKLVFPAYAQVKYDGVPLVFRMHPCGEMQAITRQNEPCRSVEHINGWLKPLFRDLPKGSCIIAECMVPGMPFKTASGIIRRHVTDERIFGVIFDGYFGYERADYSERFRRVYQLFGDARGPITPAPYKIVRNHTEAMQYWEALKKVTHPLEGMMMHSTTKLFNPGKRCWGMSRYKPQPTLDLEVHSYEEAISEDGSPLGMVGRVNVTLRRLGRAPAVVGVGPGKMTHAERTAVWRAAVDVSGEGLRVPFSRTIAEIKYMPDPTYDALRQATFQRFRPDKGEPDVANW